MDIVDIITAIFTGLMAAFFLAVGVIACINVGGWLGTTAIVISVLGCLSLAFELGAASQNG